MVSRQIECINMLIFLFLQQWSLLAVSFRQPFYAYSYISIYNFSKGVFKHHEWTSQCRHERAKNMIIYIQGLYAHIHYSLLSGKVPAMTSLLIADHFLNQVFLVAFPFLTLFQSSRNIWLASVQFNRVEPIHTCFIETGSNKEITVTTKSSFERESANLPMTLP